MSEIGFPPGKPGQAASSLLGDWRFRNIWVAGIFNGTVRWFELLFVGVYVFDMTGSAFYAALIATLRLLPIAVVGLFSGALAVRIGRRRFYLFVTAAMALVTATQFALVLTGAVQVWHLALGAVMSGVYWATDLPVRRTMLGEVTGAARVAPAMALDAATNNGTRMIGPLLGGMTLQWLGLGGAFLFGTVLHIGSFVLVMMVDKEKRSAGPSVKLLASLMEGVRIARANRMIVGTLMITVLFNLFGFPVISMIPVIGQERFGLSATMIGLMTSAEGAGAAVGSLLIARYSARPSLYNRIHWGGLLLCLVMVAAFALAPLSLLAGLALLGVGFGVAGFSTMQATLIFLSVEPELRSRLMGLLAFSIGAGPIGFLHLGWMADMLGAPTALLIMSAEGVVTLALTLAYWPEVRK